MRKPLESSTSTSTSSAFHTRGAELASDTVLKDRKGAAESRVLVIYEGDLSLYRSRRDSRPACKDVSNRPRGENNRGAPPVKQSSKQKKVAGSRQPLLFSTS